MAKKRSRTKYISFMESDLDPDRIIVSMIEFQDKIYVATQKGVYILRDEKFHHVKMVEYKGE